MIGRSLGHYRIQQQIGAGGMGVVYRARDEHLERDVALKVLPAGTLADQAARQRFRKEALALSQLNHPNIATVHDFDTSEGIDFLVMELIPGETLAEKLAAGPLVEKEISRLGGQLAQGLAAAHEHGVVHRDLKPGNLRITSEEWLKILDFGLAALRRTADEGATTVTAGETGLVAGTLPYMAPEQLRGAKADARSDIYAAGVVLYEMATGRRPFAETQGPQLVSAILEQPPPAPSAVNKRVSPGLENIILKALDKEPGRRYQSARELGVDLERLSAPVTAAAPVRRRRRWWWLATAAMAPALAAALLAFFWPGKPVESVAVLPFVNASGSPDAEYLSDGVAETLIQNLSQLPRLKVISRSLAFRYKGREADPLVVGRELKVQAVLLGRLSQRGDSLSISAELVNARDGSRIWGEEYRRKLADLLAIQEELGREISERLRLRLTGEEERALARRQPRNPEAYQEYLKGLYFWNKATGPAVQTAIGHFNNAVAKDPSYALAYAVLADCYNLLCTFAAVPGRESLPKGRDAALRALELDGSLGEAHIVLGTYKQVYEHDTPGAVAEYQRGLRLSPGYAAGHMRYSQNLIARGRFDEALIEAKRAQELDPVSLMISANIGMIHLFAERYDEALEHYNRTLSMDPNFAMARMGLGSVYVEKGMYSEAIAELIAAASLMHEAPASRAYLANAYARAGNRAAAAKLLDQMLAEQSRGYFPALYIAQVYVGLGEQDRALEWLEKAIEERHIVLVFRHPVLRPLWSHPRYLEMLKRMNVAP